MDANAMLVDETMRILSPGQRAAVLAYCGVHHVTLAEFVEMVVTRPGGAFDRAGISVEQVAALPTHGSPFTSLIASVMYAARVKE